MSRIGKSPITIPAGVTVDVQEGVIVVKGKLGELTQKFDTVSVKVEDNQVVVERSSDDKDERAKHGLYRSLINNMITGVSEGFTVTLEFVGVGYRDPLHRFRHLLQQQQKNQKLFPLLLL